ncbi:cytochrome P450 [Actinomadura craniellae]|uniref:Cytochrome P450 n=2 Tax=Actinomadura craniellae TaxID=2231787 RepID=A0A365H1L6_9ACTN|nr:cytochrome P450 [Actinomadura craniellae]
MATSRQPVLFPYDDPAFIADPFPFLNTLREAGPIHQVVLAGGMPAWLVTRYEDALALISDPRMSSDIDDATDPMLRAQLEPFPRDMLRRNPPDHTRLRRLVSKAFTARRTAELRPRIQKIADQLLDAVTPLGRADLIDDFALPLPVTVISELLGVPADDRDRFQAWTDVMLDQRDGGPDRERLREAWSHMRAYLEGLLAAKRADPGEDLISALITAHDDEQRLDGEELLAMTFLLLVAGYITTVNLIGSGMAHLLAHPDQLDLLRADPELLPAAVEEFLRYDGPVNPGMTRFPTEDIELAGVRIPRGDTVVLALAVADRDPARFPEPDRLDVSRTDNSHLAFGHGIHYCLGAPLARLEGQIAIGTLLRRLPDIALAEPAARLQWHWGGLRGLKHLPVTFTPS